jgi:hypothetical protein
VPIKVVSERAAQASATVTLTICAHAMKGADAAAAGVVEDMLRRALDQN